MSKFKILLLGLVVSFLCIWAYSSAQCVSSVNLWGDMNPKFINIECSQNTQVDLTVSCWWGWWILSFPNLPTWTIRNINYSEFISRLSSVWCNSSNVDFFSLKRYYQWGGCIVNYEQDWICVWTFSPVINWLKSSVNEFIPYVVYVWLWILTSLLWFVAIRWLINWVKRKLLIVFSSRKRK